MPAAIYYTHSITFVGDEWYANVMMHPLAAHTRAQDVLTILHVKHGWPLRHIHVVGATEQPLCLDGGIAQRLYPIDMDHRQGTPFRKDIKDFMYNSRGSLLGNEPLSTFG